MRSYVLLVALIALCEGDIRTYTATGDRRSRRFLGGFSFCSSGHLRVDVFNISTTARDLSNVDIIIEKYDSEADAEAYKNSPLRECIDVPKNRDRYYPVLGRCAGRIKANPSRVCDTRRVGSDKKRNRTLSKLYNDFPCALHHGATADVYFDHLPPALPPLPPTGGGTGDVVTDPYAMGDVNGDFDDYHDDAFDASASTAASDVSSFRGRVAGALASFRERLGGCSADASRHATTASTDASTAAVSTLRQGTDGTMNVNVPSMVDSVDLRYTKYGPGPGFWAVSLLNYPSEVGARPPALSYKIVLRSWNSVNPPPRPHEHSVIFGSVDPDADKPGRGYARPIDPPENRRYLGCGEWPTVPILLFIISFVYLALLVVWMYTMSCNRDAVRAIHWLAALALLVKSASVFVHALRDSHRAYVGSALKLSGLWYVLHTFNGIVLFVVVVLLGTGWNTVKEYVTVRERRILTVVLVLQVLINLAFAINDRAYKGSAWGGEWSVFLNSLQIVGACIVLFTMVLASKTLSSAAGADGKVAQSVRHLQLFRVFYLMLFVWLYVTRVLVPIITPQLRYTMTWVSTALFEGTTLLFVFAVGVAFRPVVVYGGNLFGGLGGVKEFVDWVRNTTVADITRAPPRNVAIGVGMARNVLDDEGDGGFLTSECLQELDEVDERTVRELADTATARAAEGRMGANKNAVAAAQAAMKAHKE